MTDLIFPELHEINESICNLELKDFAGKPHYWVNQNSLFNAQTGGMKNIISEEDAAGIANLAAPRSCDGGNYFN